MEHTDGNFGQTCKGCRYMSVGDYCRRFAIEEDVFRVWDTRKACKEYCTENALKNMLEWLTAKAKELFEE